MDNFNLNDNIERFKKTIKNEKDFLEKELSKESDISVYVQAIYLGYLDIARSFSGQTKVKKDDQTIKDIAEKMKNYIDGNENDFNNNFYAVCDVLCDEDTYKMKFGQAQKIINMAYKYLYCIANDELKNRFDNCHLPLDSVMLEWIYRNIKTADNNKLKKVDTLSKMDWGNEKEKGSYDYYKTYINNYCKDNKKTPLQLDFEHWVTVSQELAAKSYLSKFTKDEREKKIHLEILNKIIKDKIVL